MTPPALPAGWVSTIFDGPPPLWATTTVTSDTAPNNAFVGDTAVISDKRLDTPNIVIGTGSALLSFRNNYDFEFSDGTFWDGGVLEISINGAPFLDITDPSVGASFVTGGYNGTIDGTADNPLAGQMAWASSSLGYINSVVNLGPNVSGQTIQLRFRMGTDQSIGAPGWHIDTLLIADGTCPSPTPTPSTPTPTPTVTPSTPTPTPTVTPSTPTPTPTVTPSTPTPTPTVTPSTPTPTPTVTPSTPTPTPTVTPSTPTPTPSTPTPTPATPTPTPSASPTATPLLSQAINLSTRMLVQTGDNVGIGGLIITGNVPKPVIIRAIGPSLSQFNIPNVLADTLLELHGPTGFTTITNNNWRDTQEQEIQDTGIPPTNDLESAIVATLNPGAYTAIVRGNGNTSGVALVEVYDLNQGVDSKLANLATRAFVSTGDNIVIAGFLLSDNGGTNGVGGPNDDRVIVRGIGPSLAPAILPVNAVLANPTLELRDNNGTLILANNDWQDNPAQAAEIIAAGLAPTNDLESAIAATLPPGLYTALLAGMNNGTGIGVVEIYDRGAAPPGP